MNRNRFVVLVLFLVAVGLSAALVWNGSVPNVGANILGGPAGSDQSSFDAIGSASTTVRLTAAADDWSKQFATKYVDKVHFDFSYTPRSTATSNPYAVIAIDVSNDNGSNWYPTTAVSVGSQEILLYSTSGTQFSASSGIPYILPGLKNSAASTTIKAALDLKDLVADKVRLRVFENRNGGQDFGVFYARVTRKD